jgi:DNA-directed RNA polymerase specialized sigma24 family protein
MTLLEAFRAIGPRVEDPAVDAIRGQAAGLLLGELTKLARGMTFSQEIKDEIPCDVLLNLVGNSAGGIRPDDPDTDTAVRAWLRTCLRNAAITRFRKEKRQAGDLDIETARSRDLDPEQALFLQAERLEREAATQQLITEIAPAVARSFRREEHAAAFRDNLADLLALTAGETTITEVAIQRKGAATKQTMAALYQQHSRTRERLLGRIEHMAASGELTPDRTRHLRACVRRLHRRASHQ